MWSVCLKTHYANVFFAIVPSSNQSASRLTAPRSARNGGGLPLSTQPADPGRGEFFKAQVINYADDFVILSRGCAAEALNWTRNVMTRNSR
jgi:hypothetical protein